MGVPIPHTLASGDIRGRYVGSLLPCASWTGSGQSIGILEFSGFNTDDITAYETYYTLNSFGGVPTVQVLVADDPNGLPPDQAPQLPVTGLLGTAEASADIELAIAMAPQAQVIVFEGHNPYNPDPVLALMSNNPNVGQFSSSWFFGVGANTQQLLTVLAAQGQSFFQASGDWGAYEPTTATCPPNDVAAIADGGVSATEPPPTDARSMTYVTVVGGTALTANYNLFYETTWSQAQADTSTGWGSGGGILPTVLMPNYQASANPQNPEVSSTNRMLPDVAMVADNLSNLNTNCNGVGPYPNDVDPLSHNQLGPCPTAQLTPGQWQPFQGTSASAPLWAGFMALINQQAGPGLGRVGFANPAIYQIGKDSTRYAQSFRDIGSGPTTGQGSSAPNGCGFTYTAQTGYDLTTGWGTPQCGLIQQMNMRPTINVGAWGNANEGPFICISGQGFTAGGTVTVQYAGVPEVPNDVKIVSSSLTVGADGSFNMNDNEQEFVNAAVASGVTGCTADEIASGVVSVNVIDNMTGISATATMPASYWCQVTQVVSYGAICPRVNIYYEQYDACTSLPSQAGGTDFVPNGAYVVFEVDEINNPSTQTFHFDPNKLYVQQPTQQDFADSTLYIYSLIFQTFAAVPGTFEAGEDALFTQPGFLATVVSITSGDPAIVANNTSYSLYYASQLTDPFVNMIKSNASQTSWTVNESCCDIGIATCN